jgi:hypothetical protein
MMMVPQAVVVPSATPVDEDDWEWEIAMARARASAAEEMAAASMVTWPRTDPMNERFAEATRESPRVMSPAQKQLAVVRTQARRTPAPIRMAKGTRPPTTTTPTDGDTTVVTARPVGDETSPYVTMPPEVKPIGHAHTKRVAAKLR